ncbi:MAG: PilZ domain-containing protein [Candidatus Acidiferrales bacterium]
METSQKQRSEPGERRSANRYAVAMRMELWPECEKRGSGTEFARTRDISMHGVFFVSQTEHTVGTKLNFSVLFLHQPTCSEEDLISGLGRIVRCEPLVAVQELHFGIAIAIEKTMHIYEG